VEEVKEEMKKGLSAEVKRRDSGIRVQDKISLFSLKPDA
jgi:hypothetical protein